MLKSLILAPPPPPPPQVQNIGTEKSAESPVAITDMIKERFENCGELNDFHRATRAGDRRRLDMLAVRNPDIVNSKGTCKFFFKVFNPQAVGV